MGIGGLGFWLFIAVFPIIGVWDAARKRETKHETLRRIIESGKEVDPEMMEQLLGADRPRDKMAELRTGGTITMAAAAGLVVLAIGMSFVAEELLYIMLGVAGLTACVATGLLVAAKLTGRDDPARSEPNRNQF